MIWKKRSLHEWFHIVNKTKHLKFIFNGFQIFEKHKQQITQTNYFQDFAHTHIILFLS
jgi:hypothetical protein